MPIKNDCIDLSRHCDFRIQEISLGNTVSLQDVLDDTKRWLCWHFVVAFRSCPAGPSTNLEHGKWGERQNQINVVIWDQTLVCQWWREHVGCEMCHIGQDPTHTMMTSSSISRLELYLWYSYTIISLLLDLCSCSLLFTNLQILFYSMTM